MPPGSAHEGTRCRYPQSHATAREIRAELNAVATNARVCTSCYLDTIKRMRDGLGEGHHQVGRDYYLGVASYHWGWGALLTARDTELFPTCEQGAMDVSALRPARGHMFPFPVPEGTTQTKLVRDANEDWYLLGYRGDPRDDTGADDYVDVYAASFEPLSISRRLWSVHITLKGGETSFATDGTHHVEPSGRLLLSSSYRWARDEGPGDSDYVSRIDECPAAPG